MEGLRPRKAVHLEDSDLEVPARAQRRVVEGRAAVSLAEPDVLVHPDRLAVTVEHKDYIIDTRSNRFMYITMHVNDGAQVNIGVRD